MLSDLTPADRAQLERLNDRAPAMQAQTFDWARTNTGSWNTDGLRAFAPRLADAFSELDAEIRLDPAPPFKRITDKGEPEEIETGPILRVTARPSAPVQIILSGHYDTVFPPGTFTEVAEAVDGWVNGPGVTDMKGGLCIMREALLAFESGPDKDRIGYQIVVTPDEEIGNFASDGALRDAARSGAMMGMTYEPAMEDGSMSGGRKGSAVFDAVFTGRAAHAGRAKQDGRSALEAAADFVLRLEAMNGERDGVSVNVGAVNGGSAVNIVPDLAVVRFGARAPDGDAAEWATKRIAAHLSEVTGRDGIAGHMHGGFYRPPKPRNAAQQALFDAVEETGRAIGLSLKFVDTGGVCEGNNIFSEGVPNVDTLGVRGGRIHSAEEFVVLDSFAERAGLSALLLNRLADERLDAAAIKALMD